MALGYLAMLVGLFCRNVEVKSLVAARLPGGSLEHLVEGLKEFLHYHIQIDKQNHRMDDKEVPAADVVILLQGLIDDLRG